MRDVVQACQPQALPNCKRRRPASTASGRGAPCCHAVAQSHVIFARDRQVNTDNIVAMDADRFQGDPRDVAIAMARVAWNTKGEDVTVRFLSRRTDDPV